MSKNIIIQKNGTAIQYNDVPKINTPIYSGGSCSWVPEDERQLTEKTVTANGEYAAEDDGFWGYSRVTAAVYLELPFTGTTPEGVEYTVYLDNDGKPHLTLNRS